MDNTASDGCSDLSCSASMISASATMLDRGLKRATCSILGLETDVLPAAAAEALANLLEAAEALRAALTPGQVIACPE